MASLPLAEPPISDEKTSPRYPLPTKWRPRAKHVLLCMSLLALTSVCYFATHAFLDSIRERELSSQHVSRLLSHWLEDHPTNGRKGPVLVMTKTTTEPTGDLNWLWEEGDTNTNNASPSKSDDTQEAMTSSKYVGLSNRERSRLRMEMRIEELREKFDTQAEKMALLGASTTQKPIYVDYDMTGIRTNRSADGDDDDQFSCIELKVTPTVPICLYSDNKDVFVSKQIRSLGVWEGHIMDRFQKFLAADPSLGVIDVGANLGQYSLVAAAMGHPVLAVEPWASSLRRMRHAARMARLHDRIRVLRNVVADSRSRKCLKLSSADNQGDVRIIREKESKYYPKSMQYNPLPTEPERLPRNCEYSAQSLLLDDLISKVTFKRALLKLDIQGAEHLAMLHAERLLNTVFVPHIFMEWVVMRSFYVTSSAESLDKALVRRMIELLTRHGYRVFSLVSGKQLDTRYWYGWTEDVLWSHESVIT